MNTNPTNPPVPFEPIEIVGDLFVRLSRYHGCYPSSSFLANERDGEEYRIFVLRKLDDEIGSE